MKKNKAPIRIYGMAIRYTMPLLIPSATVVFPSLSRTARHMAHWALADSGNIIEIPRSSIRSRDLGIGGEVLILK